MKFLIIISIFFHSTFATAVTSDQVKLQGRVLSTFNTRVQQKTEQHSSYLLISMTSNSHYQFDTHKIEIEGLTQLGLVSNIQKLTGSNKRVEHRILINYIQKNIKTDKSLFLKISAN